jgi:hypothetical protein
MVEYTTHNGKVVGSSPTKLKSFCIFYEDFIKRI